MAPIRDRVGAEAPPGMTPEDPSHREPGTASRTVDLNRLEGVRRARRVVPARRRPTPPYELVTTNTSYQPA